MLRPPEVVADAKLLALLEKAGAPTSLGCLSNNPPQFRQIPGSQSIVSSRSQGKKKKESTAHYVGKIQSLPRPPKIIDRLSILQIATANPAVHATFEHVLSYYCRRQRLEIAVPISLIDSTRWETPRYGFVGIPHVPRGSRAALRHDEGLMS